MTFLDFPTEGTKNASTNLATTVTASKTPANRILNRVPPRIEPIKSSEVLSRAAAFLPQLAASNRAILQKRPDDVNIEILNGQEAEVIEMKLGLGVFEERRSAESSSSSSDSSDDDTDDHQSSKKKIMILPSELRRAAAAAKSEENDPFEKVINSLLLFDSETVSGNDSCDSASNHILEFE